MQIHSIAFPVEIKCSKHFKTCEAFSSRVQSGKSFVRKNINGCFEIKEGSDAWLQVQCYMSIFNTELAYLAILVHTNIIMLKVRSNKAAFQDIRRLYLAIKNPDDNENMLVESNKLLNLTSNLEESSSETESVGE